MADGTGAAPAAEPTAAPAPIDPTAGQPPVDMGAPQDDNGLAEATAAMSDGDPGSFLSNFLEGAGLSVEPGTPVISAAPQGQQPGVQPPTNGAPQAPPVNGQPQAGQPGIDPSLLQRLMAGPQAAPAPAPAWPTAPPAQPPAPTAYASQAPGQPPADPNAIPVAFDQPFQLPNEMIAALDHEDARVRAQAIGAMMAAAANTTFNKVVAYMRTTDLPRVASATVDHVQRQQFQTTVDRELFGNFPHLRYASPALVQQAAQIVVQDEIARNPAAANGPVTPEIYRKIGALASEGLKQMAGGQLPQMVPAPMPVQYAPQPYPAQPGPGPAPVWNGQQWVMPFQPAPQPPSALWMSGSTGAPFGGPGPAPVTPESEFNSFMQGGWG